MDDTSKKSEPAVRRVVWGRQFLASTVVVPPDVAEHLNTDAMAVLAVIRNEAQTSGKCSLPVARIAERANIGRAKARAATRLAEGLGLIAIEGLRLGWLNAITADLSVAQVAQGQGLLGTGAVPELLQTGPRKNTRFFFILTARL